MAFEDHLIEDARLVMVRELAEQNDGRLNESLLATVLQVYGHTRSRDWVRTQIRKLEELGAVSVTEIGNILVAQITRAGIEHIERRSVIEGIKRPALGG